MLDKSAVFKFFSWLVTLIDILAVVVIPALIVGNETFGRNPYFTIMMLYLLAPAIQNLVIDVSRLQHERELEQLVNSFLKFETAQRE